MISEITQNIKNFFFNELTIAPKYIIFCKDNEKKYVYQCIPKEQKIKINNNIITCNFYVQNAINIKSNINNYTHAIIITDDDTEYIIDQKFMLNSMFNDIPMSCNRKYKLTNILNVPIHITSKYDKNGITNTQTFVDKIKICTICGALV